VCDGKADRSLGRKHPVHSSFQRRQALLERSDFSLTLGHPAACSVICTSRAAIADSQILSIITPT
jgi:hypothetical protein